MVFRLDFEKNRFPFLYGPSPTYNLLTVVPKVNLKVAKVISEQLILVLEHKLDFSTFSEKFLKIENDKTARFTYCINDRFGRFDPKLIAHFFFFSANRVFFLFFSKNGQNSYG